MKSLLMKCVVLVCVFASSLQAQNIKDRDLDIGLTAAYWLEGTVTVNGFDGTKEGSFMFRGFIDSYVAPKLAMGAFINFSPYSQDGTDITGLEFGVAIKPRFIIDNKTAIKPGLNIGYRSLSADGFDSVQGLGVNLSLEYQKMTASNMFHVELGFLSQPSGGNDDADVEWAPIFYVGGGLTF